jgi:hypothetical protein
MMDAASLARRLERLEVPVKRLMLAAILATAVAAPAWAQVSVNIGINLPGPPPLAVIPNTIVYYAPQAPANVFFYGHQYWVYQPTGWYVGPSWNGPWAVVQPVYVPAPILKVPVRYYRVPPGQWKKWQREAPPQWDAHYGREWREAAQEREWREREEHWDSGKHKGWDKDKDNKGKGKGHS